MDIFKFTNPTAPMLMEQGELVNGLTSKMWIERYRDAGEFTVTANIDSDAREKLPIGSYISHVNTPEIMVVENHEISESSNTEPEITITGRSLETILENRIVGSNKGLPFSGAIVDYPIYADYTWNQAKSLIDHHTSVPYVIRPEDVIPNLQVATIINNLTSIQVDRAFKNGTLYSELLPLLQVDNLGIKVCRPGLLSPAPTIPNYLFVIYNGIDRSKEVVFSYNIGEITTADYLWSGKTAKNAAFVSGKWVQIFAATGPAQDKRRTMLVDGTPIDKDYTAAPAGAALTAVINAMYQLAYEAMAKANQLALSKAEVRKDGTKAIYRKDFNLGDLITVEGDYDEARVMRVSEFVEIEDINGESGHPTLTVDTPVTYPALGSHEETS